MRWILEAVRHTTIATIAAAAALALLSSQSHAESQRVDIPAAVKLAGVYYAAPQGSAAAPAIIALHGCGGLYSKSGKIAAREQDWAQRLQSAGYAVLLLDSFNPRGTRQICTTGSIKITPEQRADDVAAAARWLANRPGIDPKRLALMGWSHGAMTLLWSIRQGFMAGQPDFKTAIAFYPGCRTVARSPEWKPRVPLTILMGEADNWTEPGPCRELAAKTGARFIGYAGAVHGFDAPNSPRRTRTGLARPKNGEAEVGTDPVARAAAITEVMALLKAAITQP